jgi:hypothetical protein
MSSYFDSAVIVKLYVQETTSPDAIRLVGGYAAPYPLTPWQSLEVKNAIRLKAFRAEITPAEMNLSLAAFEQDIAAGRWTRPAFAADAVELKTEQLSASHSATLGCRTLDIVHVAAALVIGVTDFITFDGRQAALARQVGLTVKP